MNLDNVKKFKDNGYVIIPKLLSRELSNFLGIYVYNVARTYADHALDDPAVPNTPSIGADFVMESLSDFLLPKIESLTGMKLLSTYTYYRSYKAGDILEKHIDRQACEISVSLSLRTTGKIWPIYVNNTDYKTVESNIDRPTSIENMHKEYIGDTTSILLEEGDAVLYKGCEIVHWREPYNEGTQLAQVFLHYVDANGRFSEWENRDRVNGMKWCNILRE